METRSDTVSKVAVTCLQTLLSDWIFEKTPNWGVFPKVQTSVESELRKQNNGNNARGAYRCARGCW
jgi:hypothetical protein